MTVRIGALYPQRQGALSGQPYSFRNGGWADLATALGMGILSADGQNVSLPQGIAIGLQNFQQMAGQRKQDARQAMQDEIMLAELEDKRAARDAEKKRAATLAEAISGLGPTQESYENFWQQPRTKEKPGSLTAAQAKALLGLSPDAQEKVLTEQLFPKNEPYTLSPGQIRYQGANVLAQGLDPVALERDKYAATLNDRLRVAGAGRSINVTNVNTGSNGIDYGDPPKEMAWARNPDGTVKLDDRGVPLAMPIQGTDLFMKGQDQTAKTAEGIAKTSDKTARRTRSGERVLQKLDKVESAVKDGLSGVRGMVEPLVPGSKGMGIKNDIDTIRATIGGDILQMKRDESTSGASGYGQLTIQELERFEKILGSLDLAQPAGSLLENIQNIRDEYTATMERDAAERERLGLPPLGGGASRGSKTPPAISGDPTKMSPEEIYNELRAMDE